MNRWGKTDHDDHFSHCAASYATFRPGYPAELFDCLAGHSPGRRLAWDCATGNGQAALGLALHFDLVIATDASVDQITHAQSHPRIQYRVSPAERSGLEAESVDLVTVAQALHWLDKDRFFQEAHRVLAPDGVVAVWCYSLARVSSEVDEVLRAFYKGEMQAYWPSERRLVDTGYAEIAFPFDEIDVPHLSIQCAWTLAQMEGYIRTWSAVQRFVRQHGEDPVRRIVDLLTPRWGAARKVLWPLHLRVGKRTG